MDNKNTFVKSTTERLTIAELLGGVPTYGELPSGWVAPKAIAFVPIGSKVYIKNLRTRNWERGIVLDYWERGRFLEVRCGERFQKVFSTDNIAIKISKIWG